MHSGDSFFNAPHYLRVPITNDRHGITHGQYFSGVIIPTSPLIDRGVFSLTLFVKWIY